MLVSFTIQKVLSVSQTKNPLFDRAFVIVRASYQGIDCAKPMSVICAKGLLSQGVLDLVVTGSVSLRNKGEKPSLSVFVESLVTKPAKRA